MYFESTFNWSEIRGALRFYLSKYLYDYISSPFILLSKLGKNFCIHQYLQFQYHHDQILAKERSKNFGRKKKYHNRIPHNHYLKYK